MKLKHASVAWLQMHVSCQEEDDAHFMGLNCLETAESDSAWENCIAEASYHGHCEEDE